MQGSEGMVWSHEKRQKPVRTVLKEFKAEAALKQRR